MNRLLDLLALLSPFLFVGVMAPKFYRGGGLDLGVAGVAILLAVLAVWRFVAWQRRDAEHFRRIDNGLCVGCGYDLRSSTDHCPECGRKFKSYEKVKLRWGEGEGGLERKA